MTQPIYVNGKHPKTKKEVKEAIKADPSRVSLQSNGFFPNGDHVGPISALPVGKKAYFVGPTPTDRKWYGNVERLANGTIRVE